MLLMVSKHPGQAAGALPSNPHSELHKGREGILWLTSAGRVMSQPLWYTSLLQGQHLVHKLTRLKRSLSGADRMQASMCCCPTQHSTRQWPPLLRKRLQASPGRSRAAVRLRQDIRHAPKTLPCSHPRGVKRSTSSTSGDDHASCAFPYPVPSLPDTQSCTPEAAHSLLAGPALQALPPHVQQGQQGSPALHLVQAEKQCPLPWACTQCVPPQPVLGTPFCSCSIAAALAAPLGGSRPYCLLPLGCRRCTATTPRQPCAACGRTCSP